MKTIIAGSRDVIDYAVVLNAIGSCPWLHQITEVVSGTARGVDRFGERWAAENQRPVAKFPADWDLHGKAAGFIRNRQMAEYADALIAIWDGRTRGTRNMVDEARARRLHIHLYRYDLGTVVPVPGV